MNIPPELIILTLQSNKHVLLMQAEGISHEESLAQAPFAVNCFNWVVGHIVEHRDTMLKLLGEEPVLTPDEAKLYATGSDAILAESDAVQFERLLQALDIAQTKLETRLQMLTVNELAQLPEPDAKRSLGQSLHGLAWHETYHVGQTEYARQMAGKADKVV